MRLLGNNLNFTTGTDIFTRRILTWNGTQPLHFASVELALTTICPRGFPGGKI